MTEVEAWTLLVDFNTAGMNGMALYLTVASGYLIVAYLAGKQLTTYQVALISVMFVVFALLFTYGVIGIQVWVFTGLVPDAQIRQQRLSAPGERVPE